MPYMMVIHRLTKMRQEFGPPLFASTNFDLRILPEFHWVIAEFAVFVMVEEILFYYSHKLAHHRKVSIISTLFTVLVLDFSKIWIL